MRSTAASVHPTATMVTIISQYPSSSSGRALARNVPSKLRKRPLALSSPNAKLAAFRRYHSMISSVATPNPPPRETKYTSNSSQTARDNATLSAPSKASSELDASSNAFATDRLNSCNDANSSSTYVPRAMDATYRVYASHRIVSQSTVNANANAL